MFKILIVKLLILKFIVLGGTNCDHVSIVSCGEDSLCLNNVDGEILNIIGQHMYNETDPCDNFWDYACGSWTAQPYYDHEDTFGAMTNYYADQLKATLENLHTSGPDEELTDMINKIWQYYQSCRSSGSYSVELSKYFQQLPIEIIFGDALLWDVKFQQDSLAWDSYNWLATLAVLRKYGLNGVFLEESIAFASNDSLRYVMEIKLPRPESKFQYKSQISEIFQDLDLPLKHNAKSSRQLINDIYELDQDLINLYRKYESSRNQSQIIWMKEFSEDKTSWQLYFDTLAADDSLVNNRLPLEIYGSLEYFQDLHILLSATDNYLIAWYLLLNFGTYLDDVKPSITERDCLLHTNVMFPLGLNYVYNRFIYQNRHKDELILQGILQKLKLQFTLHLDENKFHINDQELQYLREKLAAVQLKIGNLPDQLPHFNDVYSNVNLSTNNFHANHLEMLQYRFHQQHRLVLGREDCGVVLKTYYVNDDISRLRNAPYFIHPRNLLVVPEIFLQLPFYHHRQHSLFHYSIVGWIMAHELSHVFDIFGLLYDSQGNVNSLGLQIARKPSFKTAMNCLQHPYPTASLNERIADVNGLQIIWQVYLQQFKDHHSTSLTDLKHQQLFFLNFAQFFCGSLPKAIAHDRDDVRVKVSVANVKEFSEIFQCPRGTEVNRYEKCDIWRK